MKATFDKENIQLLAICGQGKDRAEALATKLGLGFALLADPDLAVTRAWGVADPVNKTAWPAVFAVDRTQRIRWRQVSKTYPVRPTSAELADAIKALAEP